MSESNPISPVSKVQSFISDNVHITPGLYIVATPIGNLRDITLRALDILSAADIILAEDTRHTQKLLSAYSLKGRLVSYYDHNAAGRIPMVMEALSQGKIVAQVSDAGTPLVSDPGFKLVQAAIEQSHSVVPVPGASAVLAALAGAGLPTDIFTFAGFLPSKAGARRSKLKTLETTTGTLVFFESGHRIIDMLEDVKQILGDRDAVLARELTKTYEEFRRGSVSELLTGLTDNPARGEIVILLGPAPETQWGDVEIDAALKDQIPDLGVKRASAAVADLSGWNKRDVYQRALALK